MRNTINIKGAIGLISAVILLAGLIYGCYSREGLPEEKNIYGQDIRPNPLSEAELRKFVGSIRRVDGEAEAHYRLALYFQEKYRYKLAIDELKQVLLRDSSHAKAYNALGVSFDNLGDHDAAIDNYKLALNIDSKLDYACNNLGYSYLLKGDLQKAVEAFRQAIALNPDEMRYRNNLGLAYVKLGQFESAYEQFAALDSESNARKTLAKVMADLGKSAETETVLLAIKTAPKKEVAVQPEAPVERLPDLSSLGGDASSAYDPVARFRKVRQNLNLPPDEQIQDPAGQPASSEKAIAAVVEILKNEKNLDAEEEEEPLKGPVINVPASAAPDTSHTINVDPAGAAPKEAMAGSREAIRYYHASSVAISQGANEPGRSRAQAKTMEYQAKPVMRQPREILPPRIEIIAPMNQEEHEERILVAASSTRAGGWQVPPEPRQTAEKGIVEVEVANGNGVKGAAGRVAAHLRRCGFKVVRVMDAQSHDHFSTKVFYYGGNLTEARRLLKAIPEITADAELYELESMGSHIRLLIGKDLVERNQTLTWSKPRSISSGFGG